MNHVIVVVVAMLCACAPTSFETTFGPRIRAVAPKAPQHKTILRAGECVFAKSEVLNTRRDGLQAFDASAVGGAILGSLIKQGLDAAGNALDAAAKENSTTAIAQRNLELSIGEAPTCVQIWRGLVYDDPASSTDLTSLDPQHRQQLKKIEIYPAAEPDFFLELWLRSSSSRAAFAVGPTLLAYNKTLDTGGTPCRARGFKVSLAIRSPGAAGATSTGEMVLGAFGVTPLYKFRTACEYGLSDAARAKEEEGHPKEDSKKPTIGSGAAKQADFRPHRCDADNRLEAAWLPSPFVSATSKPRAPKPAEDGETDTKKLKDSKPAADSETDTAKPKDPKPVVGGETDTTPFTVTLTVTEVRPSSRVLTALAALFKDSRATLETELKQTLIKSEREKEEQSKLEASKVANTNLANAVSEAELSRLTYCQLGDGDDKMAARLTASVDLYRKQLAANVASGAAGVSPRYRVLVSYGLGPVDRTFCTD